MWVNLLLGIISNSTAGTINVKYVRTVAYGREHGTVGSVRHGVRNGVSADL